MSIQGVGPGNLLEALRSGRIQGKEAQLEAASSLFESFLVQEMYRAMRESVPEGGMVDGGMGEDVFTDMLDQQLAEITASRIKGGIGHAVRKAFGAGEGGP